MTFFEKHYYNGELYFEYIKEGCLETNQEPCDKVMTFFEKHYYNGELYFEYIKEGCLETNQEPCDKCVNVEWVGPRCSRVPSPMPDPNNEGHYLPLSDTSTTTVNGD